jgi:hypothetical protein
MTDRTVDPMDGTAMDAFDRELRRLLEWDASLIDGAPTRAEMHARLLDRPGIVRRHHGALGSNPALRVVLAVGLMLALLAGAIAAGSQWVQRKETVTRPTPPASASVDTLDVQIGSVPEGSYWSLANTTTPYTMDVPVGWTRGASGDMDNGARLDERGVAFGSWIVTHVFDDVCHWMGAEHLLSVGTRELLATALAAQSGHPPATRTELQLGGALASRIVISIPRDYDATGCDAPNLPIWPPPTGNPYDGLWLWEGMTLSALIVDGEGDGKSTAVIAMWTGDSNPADVAEVQEMLDSVRFWP